jgi:predicted RNA-binding protein with PIN domain
MRYLIDGYNLLHAVGSLHGRTGLQALLRARKALLEMLARQFGEGSNQLTVVFDAAGHLPEMPARLEYHGIEVLFAVREASADDLIETLIRQSTNPRSLTVVSSDHRIQRAASRKDCIVKSSTDFLDDFQKRSLDRPGTCDSPSKPPDGFDAKHWLQEFRELENDPNLKFLSDPVEWSEDDL